MIPAMAVAAASNRKIVVPTPPNKPEHPIKRRPKKAVIITRSRFRLLLRFSRTLSIELDV
jgi:hypothetical protein